MYKILFIRCKESVEPDIFKLITEQINKIAAGEVRCETLNLIKLNYVQGSYFNNILDLKRMRYIKDVINQKKPDIIVSGNDIAISAGFIKVCNLKGIPSLVVQHGILADITTSNPTYNFLYKNILLWKLVSIVSNMPAIAKATIFIGWRTRVLEWGMGGATKFVVMGSQSMNWLISNGMSRDRIIITGFPLFDLIPLRKACFNKQKTLEKLGLDKNKPIIVYATQAFVEDGFLNANQRKELAKAVIDSSVSAGIQMIIKVHPREDATDYENLSRLYKDVKVIKYFDLHELILLSDIVITLSSTAGLWALAYEKTLVTISCFPNLYTHFYNGATFEAQRLDDLPKILETILKEPNCGQDFAGKREMWLHNHAYKLDGHSSFRIAQAILAMLKQKPQKQRVAF